MYTISNTFYHGESIEAADDLTAIRLAKNFDADLFKNGKLFFHRDWSEDMQRDAYGQVGIIWSEERKRWEYEVQEKNSNMLYASVYEYVWDGKPFVDVKIHDFRMQPEDIPFDSVEKVVEMVRTAYQSYPKESVHIRAYHLGAKKISL